MTDARYLLAATAAAVVVFGLAVFVGFVSPVAADHGSPGDWTVEPETNEDRQPGYESASYIHWAQGGDDFRGDGLETLDQIEMVSDDLGFADCDLEDAAAFGIDRGGNNEGTETDDSLAPHIKEFEFAEDRMWMEIYDEDDFMGGPTHLDADDQFVAHQLDCYTNPESEGWYQMEGWANGTAYDGEFDEARLHTHYFWIGDYDSEEEAREALGPPPSEADDGGAETPTPTPAPAGEDTDDDAAGDDGDGADDAADDDTTDADTTDGDATDDGTDTGADDTATPEDDAETGDADDTDDDDAAAAAGADDDGADDPSPGDGPGFGAVAAIAALLGAVLALRRR